MQLLCVEGHTETGGQVLNGGSVQCRVCRRKNLSPCVQNQRGPDIGVGAAIGHEVLHRVPVAAGDHAVGSARNACQIALQFGLRQYLDVFSLVSDLAEIAPGDQRGAAQEQCDKDELPDRWQVEQRWRRGGLHIEGSGDEGRAVCRWRHDANVSPDGRITMSKQAPCLRCHRHGRRRPAVSRRGIPDLARRGVCCRRGDKSLNCGTFGAVVCRHGEFSRDGRERSDVAGPAEWFRRRSRGNAKRRDLDGAD